MKTKPKLLKLTELVELIKEKSPKVLDKIPEKKAVALIRAALAELGRHIAEVVEGGVKVQGLGNFRSRMVEREKDGKKVSVKRIAFLTGKPKSKDESKKKGKDKNQEQEEEQEEEQD